MYGRLECARVLVRAVLPAGWDGGPLVKVLPSLERYVERRFFAFAWHREATGAVEDGVDLGVLPELIHRDERVAELQV